MRVKPVRCKCFDTTKSRPDVWSEVDAESARIGAVQGGYRVPMPAIARWSLVALDARDHLGLARFYSQITGWPIRNEASLPPDDDWIELVGPGGATLAFQLAHDHEPPTWPSAEHPQQLHLDFDVPDLDEGERAVLAIGARKADVQPGTSFRVFLDPAGHPFCLVLDRQLDLARLDT